MFNKVQVNKGYAYASVISTINSLRPVDAYMRH